MNTQLLNDNVPTLNYYHELGIDAGCSIQEIQAKIRELKKAWGQRASLVGKRGDEARKTLKIIDNALEVFKDEESKERYDRTLRPGTSDGDEGVDWVSRAWTYYFAKDNGPAMIAARKARENCPTDPTAFVVSAWIALAEDQYDRAEELASEAFVLDELGEDTFDVHKVRGVTFFFQKKYDRAIEAFTRALSRATPVYKSEINWFLSLCSYDKGDYASAMTYALSGLAFEEGAPLHNKLIETAQRAILTEIRDIEDNEEVLKKLYHYRRHVENSGIPEAPRKTLINFIERWIEVTNISRELEELELKMEVIIAPDFPFKSIVAAFILFIVLISHPSLITFLLFAIPSAWIGFYIYRVFSAKELARKFADKKREFDRAVESAGLVSEGDSWNVAL